jgi:2-keto-4-pentenoate hydratase/2-oxohepta-3-ene-1,7-dioic acid hydratase in catechol pathway
VIGLVRFDGGRTGVVRADRVIDAARALPELSPGASWMGLIADWGRARPALERLLEEAPDGSALGDLALEPPLPHPSARVFAMGGNFPMHTAQTAAKLEISLSEGVTSAAKQGVPPWGFYVIPGTVVGPGHEIAPPAGTQKLDYEAEVAVVLGPRGSDGTVGIWGWTAWNDFSIRDPAFGLSKVDHGPLTWSLQKNFATGNACGPVMVIDAPIPPEGLRIVGRVHGELRQDGRTSEMKYGFEEIVAHIEEYLPLGPGDMILSGTPAGTGMEGGPDGPFLSDGEVCEVEVIGAGEGERTGVLRNHIRLPRGR